MQYNDKTYWKYEYNLSDHLGNVRIVFAAHSHGQPELMQQTIYYPYGMILHQQNFGGTLDQPNKMLYNGKELQDDQLAGMSLDWYDYGARFYDPQIGRWHVVDPIAHERSWVSPYNFVQNNPINRIDRTGTLDHEYDVDLKIGKVKRVSEKGGEVTHYFNIIETNNAGDKSKLAEYSLNINEFGLVPFPESGPNWGRYGSRDAGGDNWASPETAGAFFGLLYDWAKDPLTDMVYFDDISGDKGQDIGHTTHRTGNDIDIRYFGAGNGPNVNGSSVNCSTCWNTISNRSEYSGDLLYFSTYNFLRTADKWGFNQNYAYPKGFPYTKDKSHYVHRHHLHIGRR
ncbi:MAG: RHS repeat-associated core domain-containing protein [Bacteroidales bacterium]|nr:RHS repeat-associated core domain-containing protein [Bacteroidales bacterium]